MSDIGLEFEKDWAEALGGDVKPGSGNKWYVRGDVGDREFVWSCKATKHASRPITWDEFREIVEITQGPGGHGDATPGMAIRLEAGKRGQSDFVVLRKEDFIRIVTEDTRYVRQSRAEARREASKVPQLLREEDEDYTP